ncbi:MAG: hypothetical protein KGJ58_01890 [Patescibacteria group bacterium]|nr:hypothetical protein [Patescibacteria group bacterium]MDE1988085.1 hypothetical protein [Patescibacteria group bacterium]MDE2218190.1 hypothetical protein [Patescibacteria group bacterium]
MKNIEGNLEGFDQNKHRILEDNKSWVLKETPKKLYSDEDHYIYNELVDKVVSSNTALSQQEAYDKIKELETKYEFDFSNGTEYLAPHASEVLERKKLYIFQELNIIDREEKEKLDKISVNFEKTAEEVANKDNEDVYAVRRILDMLLLYGRADNLQEAKEMIMNGPVVKGFEDSEDEMITNDKVKSFILNTFEQDVLNDVKIGKIIKDNKYLINPGRGNIDKGNDLVVQGICKWTAEGFLLAEDKNLYLQAEKFLEGVDDDNKLSHVYKIRAATSRFVFAPIKIESFGVEKPSDFDYLKNFNLIKEEDKESAYILGTIAHEVAHKIDIKLDQNLKDEYENIIEKEFIKEREKYVSDYVVRNKNFYKNPDSILIREDIAEAVRIYVTNPVYLESNYPLRFNFIKQKMPYIKSGSIVDFLKQK